jgi:hypothetical protein
VIAARGEFQLANRVLKQRRGGGVERYKPLEYLSFRIRIGANCRWMIEIGIAPPLYLPRPQDARRDDFRCLLRRRQGQIHRRNGRNIHMNVDTIQHWPGNAGAIFNGAFGRARAGQ